MSKAILLCRVSTEVQDYEAQISDLKKYAESKGITECHVIASKESGYKSIHEREGWAKTKEFFDQHPDYDTLIVTEISRLGRRETAIAEIKEYIERNKKSLYIKDINLHLYDKGKKKPESDIVFSVFASMATTEMSLKKERFLRSRRNLNEQGYSIVGPVLFGYKRVRDEIKGKNKFVVSEKEAKEINEIYNIYLYGLDGKDVGIRGLVLYAISKGMSKYLHSKRNMTKMLNESAYIGGVKEVRIKKKNPEYWIYNDKSKPTHIETVSHIPYPSIVTKSLFDAVQKKKLSNRILVDKSKKHDTILSKLIECPECHTFMHGDYRKGRGTASYRCAKHKDKRCSNGSVICMPYIDSLVWCYLKSNVKKIIEEIYRKNFDVSISSIEDEILNCEEKKRALQEEVKSLSVIFRNEVRIFGLDEAQQKYDKGVKQISERIDEIEAVINGHKGKIREIERRATIQLTDEDMDMIENDKKKISEYIHLLVYKVFVYNTKKYTFIRVILNGDDEHTFRGILADKSDTIRIKAFGIKREKDMPFKVRNKETKNEDGEILEWVESGINVLEKLLFDERLSMDKIELYPIEFKRLKVYDDDF
jgi:DNA invertase Pin-like site-specific DNA recombinase